MRLSDHKGKDGLAVVGKILEILPRIAVNEKVGKATYNPVAFASALLTETPDEAMAMLAIVNNRDLNTYEFDAATVLLDIVDLVSDPPFMQLFGVQRQTSTSSTSATESTEAEVVPISSATAKRGSSGTRKKKRSDPT